MKAASLACLAAAFLMSACASVSAPLRPGNGSGSVPVPTNPVSPATETDGTEAAGTPTAPLSGDDLGIGSQGTTGSTLSSALQSQGQIRDSRLGEISGLAASNHQTGLFWALNDSGNLAQLFRLNARAELVDVWNLNVDNRDWEAMASLVIDGNAYLAIADTGDNARRHAEARIHLVAEPNAATGNGGSLTPVRTLTFRYEGGPRDVEAIGVAGNELLLLSKERLVSGRPVASQLFSLPLSLQASSTQPQVARNIGRLALPSRGFRDGALTRLLNLDPLQPTDMSISADGRHAFVLNYVQVLHYPREMNESWVDRFARPPAVLQRHGLRQAEALTTNALGEVWLTSEGTPAAFLAFKAFEPTPPFN